MEFVDVEFSEQMNAVYWYLMRATEYGLEAEVVTYALKYMKENPELSYQMAMEYAYDEWVK